MIVIASHNTPSATATVHSQELEDRIMAALPRRISDWLRYEATGDTDTVVIFQEWRRGMTEDQILAGLKAVRRQDTIRDYGIRHPQAALPKAA